MKMDKAPTSTGCVSPERHIGTVLIGDLKGWLRELDRRPGIHRASCEHSSAPTLDVNRRCTGVELVHNELMWGTRPASQSANSFIPPVHLVVNSTTDHHYFVDVERQHTKFAKPTDVACKRKMTTIGRYCERSLGSSPRRTTVFHFFGNHDLVIAPKIQPPGVISQRKHSTVSWCDLLLLTCALNDAVRSLNKVDPNLQRVVPRHMRNRPCLPQHGIPIIAAGHRWVSAKVMASIIKSLDTAFCDRHHPDRTAI
jgi:hypothetical protein